MNFPRPDKTSEHIFAEFLADQATRDLHQSYLKRDWPDYWRKEYGATFQPEATFRDPFEAEDLIGGFSGYLDDFLPHEIAADAETMRVAGMVLKRLGSWLAAKGNVGRDENTLERTCLAARDLLAAQHLLNLFRDWLAEASALSQLKSRVGLSVIPLKTPHERKFATRLFSCDRALALPMTSTMSKITS